MIYVCWADVSGLDAAAEAYELSSYRREKLDRMKEPLSRKQGIGAELLLQRALKHCRPELPLPPVIACAEGGKPFLRDAGLFFNLSHSGAFAACAVSDAEIGLDIQVPVQAREELVRRVFTPREASYISAAEDRDAAFTELWCKKESFIKMTGKGLSAGLRSVCVLPEERGELRFHIEHLPSFFLSVCWAGREEQHIETEEIELP